jgi:hypothetical protein
MLIITQIPSGKYIPEKTFKRLVERLMRDTGWDHWTTIKNLRWSYNLGHGKLSWLQS